MRRIRWQPYSREPLFGWADDHPVLAWVAIVTGIIGTGLLLAFAGARP